MKYTILINQEGVANLGLVEKTDLIDWAIIDYLKDWFFVERKKKIYVEEEKECYVWLNYNYLLSQMPLVKIDKSNLSRRIKKLRELGLIKTYQAQDRSIYYTLTPFCIKVLFHKAGDVEDEPSCDDATDNCDDATGCCTDATGCCDNATGCCADATAQLEYQLEYQIDNQIDNNSSNNSATENFSQKGNYLEKLKILANGGTIDLNVERLYKLVKWSLLPHPSDPNRLTTVRQMLMDVVCLNRRVRRLYDEEELVAVALNNAIVEGELSYERFAQVYRRWQLSGVDRIMWFVKALVGEGERKEEDKERVEKKKSVIEEYMPPVYQDKETEEINRELVDLHIQLTKARLNKNQEMEKEIIEKINKLKQKLEVKCQQKSPNQKSVS